MTTKPASETPETDAAWQNFGQRSMRISGREITMVVRREDMRALERRLREAEEKLAAPVVSVGKKCKNGHDGYWITHFGNCMACRAEAAEKLAEEWEKGCRIAVNDLQAAKLRTASQSEVFEAAMRWYECLQLTPSIEDYAEYDKAFAALRTACESPMVLWALHR